MRNIVLSIKRLFLFSALLMLSLGIRSYAQQSLVRKVVCDVPGTDSIRYISYICNNPQVSDSLMLDSIIRPFHGNVVLIDYWATWCGPCHRSIAEIKPLKEQLKQQKVVYVYLTNESSPEITWGKMLMPMGGFHFRISAKQWDFLMDKYGINGIPAYQIINKYGELYFQHIGFPGVETLKEEIDKTLAEE